MSGSVGKRKREVSGISLSSCSLAQKSVDDDFLNRSHSSSSKKKIYLTDLLREAKKSLQRIGDPMKHNGVTFALFGSSGSGKSTIIRKIFIDDLYKNGTDSKTGRGDEHSKKDDFISCLFTESKHTDAFRDLDDDDIIVDACGFNEDVYQWMYAMNYTYDKKYNFVVMIDDVLSVKSLPSVFKAFLTYRNMNITSIVSLQYLKLCPLAIRSSLYFCFLLPLNSNEGIEQLVKGYLGIYLPGKTLAQKINRYKEMCSHHRFFLMDNLNHKCYYVDNEYFATEMETLPAEECLYRGGLHDGVEEKEISSSPPFFQNKRS